jgi:hypothetical protein
MQFNEEEDENLGYEDVNEVLADDSEPHDETEGHGRIRRTDVRQN